MSNINAYVKTKDFELETHIEIYNGGLSVFQSVVTEWGFHVQRISLDRNLMIMLQNQLNEVLNESKTS